MRAMASRITSVLIVCSTVCSGADRRKHQSSHHKRSVTRKMFPFDGVIMKMSLRNTFVFTSTSLSSSGTRKLMHLNVMSSVWRGGCITRCWSKSTTWWRHQIDTFSALLALCAGNSPVTVEFPAQRPVTRSFEVSFDLRLNKRLSNQSWGWWFETPSRSFWRNRNGRPYLEWGVEDFSIVLAYCCHYLCWLHNFEIMKFHCLFLCHSVNN